VQIASVSLLDGRRCVPLSRCKGRFTELACLPESPARTARVVGARTSCPGQRNQEHAAGFVISAGARAPTCQRAAPAVPNFLPPVCRCAGSRSFDGPAAPWQAGQAVRSASARRFKDSAAGQMPSGCVCQSDSRRAQELPRDFIRVRDRDLCHRPEFSSTTLKRARDVEMNVADCLPRRNSVVLPYSQSGL
jgi:hypothetical protein